MVQKQVDSQPTEHKHGDSKGVGLVERAKMLLATDPKFVNYQPEEELAQSDVHPYPDLLMPEEMLAHGENVVKILQEWGANDTLQAAGMLHSLVWNCVLSADDVEEACGKDVLFLCQAYRQRLEDTPTKAPQATSKTSASNSGRKWSGKLHILQRIKYFMLAYENVDLALLAAADLWSHFDTISRNYSQSSTSHQNKKSSQDTQHKQTTQHKQENRRSLSRHSSLSLRRQIEIVEQICKPYFEFLGLHELKESLDAWLFTIQNNEQKSDKKGTVTKEAEQEQREREALLSTISTAVDSFLPDAQIDLRPFLHLHTASSEVSTDSSAAQPDTLQTAHNINIVVDTVDQCYQTLGYLHQLYTPVDGGINDQLRNNRLNGYRMLQTAAVVPIQVGESETQTRVRVNFHICTREMDAINRWGLVAVYLRNQSDTKLSNVTGLSNVTELSSATELPNVWWRNAEKQCERIQSSPIGTLPDTLYVFSPQGQLFEFHLKCTVVDYAYRVHSRLADHCRQFLINGETVEPATVLHHLDLVELQYDPHTSGPTRVWLNAARTQRARTAINRFLRNHRRDIYRGQQKMDKEISRLEDHYGFHIPQHQIEQALSLLVRKWSFPSINDLMGEIAASRLQPHRILHPLFAKEIVRQMEIPAKLKVRPHMVDVMQCCRPRVGEDIIGLPQKRGEAITKLKIHTKDCAAIKQIKNRVTLKWRIRPELKEVTRIVMRARDEYGLLGSAVNQIYEMAPSVTLHKSEAVARYGEAHLSFVVETESREVLEELADALRRLPDRDIIEVRHMSLSLTEREEFGHSITGNRVTNPYTRSPVYEEGKFFGRKNETERIVDLLRSREDVVWVCGHKRVGKTSLLQYLKNTKLDPREFVPVFFDFQMLSNMNTETICFELARKVYEELQDNKRSVNEVSPPVREFFQREPINRFISYLRSAQDHANIGRIVLLIDEFSRTTDTYYRVKVDRVKVDRVKVDRVKVDRVEQNEQAQQTTDEQAGIDENFFAQWRGMIQAQQLNVGFVIVVQQQALDNIRERVQGGEEDPSWQLLEVGEQIELRPLDKKDASDLIERPLRNYLELSPHVINLLYDLTGGSTFLIHAFCSKLVTHMAQLDRKQVTEADIAIVSEEFMSTNESVFAHLLDLTRNIASQISDQIALMLDEQIRHDPACAQTACVEWHALHAALPNIDADLLRRMLMSMCERHILERVEPDSWRFTSSLFQQWLARNQR